MGHLTDQEREIRITETYCHLLAEEDENRLIDLKNYFNKLISERSPEQVARMEKEKGLV